MIRSWTPQVAFLLTLTIAAAAEGKERHQVAADAAIEAFDAKRSAVLKEIASRSVPDPWEVADELFARRRLDVARAFACAAPRFEVARLLDWLSEAATHEPDQEGRRAFAAAVGHFRRGAIDQAIAGFLTVDSGWPSVTSMLALGEVPFLQARLGRFQAALKTARRAADRAQLMGWHSMHASMQEVEGRLLLQLDRPQEARGAFEQALTLAKRLPNAALIAGLLRHIAKTHSHRREFEDAIGRLREALEILKGPPSRLLAMVHFELGDAWGQLEDRPRALAAYQASKDLATDIGLGALAADALTNMAIELSTMGDPESALAPLRQALKIDAERREPLNAASSYHLLSTLCWRMGRLAEALDALEHSLRYARRSGDAVAIATAELTQGDYLSTLGHGQALRKHLEAVLELASRRRIDPSLHAQVLQSMADVLEAEGDPDGARASYERAIAVLSEHKRGVALAGAKENLALFDHRTGRGGDALALLRELIDEHEARKQPHAAAPTRANLAQLLVGTDPEAARRELDKALKLAIAAGNAPLQRLIYLIRADWHARATQWSDALADIKRARTLAHRAVRGLSDLRGTAAREDRRSVFELGLGVAYKLENADEAVSFLESGRAEGLLQGLAGREAVRAATLPPALLRAERLARARETAAQHQVSRALEGGRRAVLRAARAALDAARVGREAIAAKLERHARRTSDIVDAIPASRAALEASLAPGEVLVLYGTTPKRFVAVRVAATGTHLIDLGSREPIEALARAFDAGDAASDPSAAVAELRRRVVDPLALDPSFKRVLVSPAAALAYVPFVLLMPDRDIVHVPSGTTRLLLQGEGSVSGTGVLGIGDPDYRHSPPQASRVRSGRLVALPSTRAEIMAVADVRLLGREATEQGLRGALMRRKRWRSVHFACHGLVDAEHPLRSALALTAGGNDDGYLTALDIMRLRAPSDLVVLSACETGRGKVFSSEGVVGLTRAFMFAGTPRIICSLWKVDDEATQALMIKLYELWSPESGRGLPLVSALRAAQAHLRTQPRWKHPYYWAAWQLWGLGE